VAERQGFGGNSIGEIVVDRWGSQSRRNSGKELQSDEDQNK
jgi:hypothetical protein